MIAYCKNAPSSVLIFLTDRFEGIIYRYSKQSQTILEYVEYSSTVRP